MSEKTFTLEEVKKFVGSAMNLESPLGKKIMANFNGLHPQVEAKEILDEMNKKRFENSGYVHGLDPEVKPHLMALVKEQIECKFSELPEAGFDREAFEAGYIQGMGCKTLSELL